MNAHYTYLAIDAATIAGPLALSFDRRVAFYKQWKYLWLPMLITAAVFIAWDALFTAQGVWWFSEAYTLPYRIAGLPVEEWLFFIVVPYACCFVAGCMDVYFPRKGGGDTGWTALVMLAVALLIFAGLNYRRAYTCWACGGCGLALTLAWVLRIKNPLFFADRFLLAYGICLFPFLLVNGLLTALPVVLYNDAENIGVRIYTIPAEDVFYGMLLVLGNVWGMRRMQSRRIGKSRIKLRNE